MNEAILEWLGGDDTGSSSKAIALTALRKMPKEPSYPSDGDDFGRCYRLLQSAPEARRGLDQLEREGGPVWRALVPRWREIEAAYLHDMNLHEIGRRNVNDYRCYKLMKSIILPAEESLRNKPIQTSRSTWATASRSQSGAPNPATPTNAPRPTPPRTRPTEPA